MFRKQLEPRKALSKAFAKIALSFSEWLQPPEQPQKNKPEAARQTAEDQATPHELPKGWHKDDTLHWEVVTDNFYPDDMRLNCFKEILARDSVRYGTGEETSERRLKAFKKILSRDAARRTLGILPREGFHRAP